jgi:IS5 family transposase
LNEAREKTDAIIDELHTPLVGNELRPRTYRVKARRAFLSFTKKKKPGRKAIRKAKRQQLGFLCRNLTAIDRLLENPEALPLSRLSRRMYKNLLVCREVYRQQLEMFENNTQRVDDRIVSISQPHVRPIKRGKAGRETEFGAKLSLSVVGGFSFVDRLSWDNYNEGPDLIEQIETYQRRFGFYPESVHVDKIYRTRANRVYCKAHGIRISGPPLGRPPKHVSVADKKQATADEAIRNQVEGKFGQGKRRFGLGRIMAKLAGTSAAQISLSFLVMNLERALVRIFLSLILAGHRLAQLAVSRQGRRPAAIPRPT